MAKTTIKHNKGNAGGYLVGRKHTHGGIKAINKGTGQPLEMEGGEVVITAPAVEDKTLVEFQGRKMTKRQVLSAINESGGGVSFAKGGKIPGKIKYRKGQSYKVGGQLMTAEEVVQHCGCGCAHTNRTMAYGGTFGDRFQIRNDKGIYNRDLSTGKILFSSDGYIMTHEQAEDAVAFLKRKGFSNLEIVPAESEYEIIKQEMAEGGTLDRRQRDYKLLDNRVGLVDSFAKGGQTEVVSTPFKGTAYKYANAYDLNKAIEALIDNTPADQFTSEQKAFLKYYSGYGGLEKFGAEGKGLLYEYFTPSLIAEKMWGLAYKYGFSGGDVCEPAAGIGEFVKYAPDQRMVTCYEINAYSAKIISILYPKARVYQNYFEELFIVNRNTIKGKTSGLKKYDLVIGNPPYGEFSGKFAGMGEKDYTRASNYIDYFIFRGLDLLVPGGLLVYIVGAEVASGGKCFLSQQANRCKDEIMEKADLLDAYRLPNGVFERTDVLTDIIVLRKMSKIESIKIKGTVPHPAGNYYGVYSGHVVKIWTDGKWIEESAELGIRGTVNCIVKIDRSGQGVIVFKKRSDMSHKLEQLKDQIRQQLNLCSSVDTPTVCRMKSDYEGYGEIERLILQKVMYTDNISIADAIVDIENEFNINAAE